MSVLGVHVEQFVDQGVVVCLEAWCGVPLALLLKVSEVGVFSGVVSGGVSVKSWTSCS